MVGAVHGWSYQRVESCVYADELLERRRFHRVNSGQQYTCVADQVASRLHAEERRAKAVLGGLAFEQGQDFLGKTAQVQFLLFWLIGHAESAAHVHKLEVYSDFIVRPFGYAKQLVKRQQERFNIENA